jgi:hypothetical protein
MKRYRNTINAFTGFQQSDHARSGFEDGFFDHLAPFQNAETMVFAPRTWKSNVKVLADQQRRQGVERAAIISYSHGQAAATAYAKYAHSIGIHVDLWLACDPVYRPTWLPRWTIAQPFAFQALMKKGTIKVPKCITRSVYVRQERNRPYGHDLIPSRDHQVVELGGVFHTYGHTDIDAAPEWWSLVAEELAAWQHPPVAIPKAIPIPEP